MNNFRIEALKALKSAFGNRIIGGLSPNEYTLKMHSDVQHLINHRNPRPQGVVRVQRLCQLNGKYDTPMPSCPHNLCKGVSYEPFQEVSTHNLALQIPHSLGSKISISDPQRRSG